MFKGRWKIETEKGQNSVLKLWVQEPRLES